MWTRKLGAAVVVSCVVASSGCGGGGGGDGGGWRTIRIDRFTPPESAALASPYPSVVVGEVDTVVHPSLVFRSDGTPLVAYFAPLVWEPMNFSGELRIATVEGEAVDTATLVPEGTQHWSGLGIDGDDQLGFFEHVDPGPDHGFGWFTSAGAGATLAATSSEAIGFVQEWGRPVLAPGGALTAPVLSRPIGNSRLSLFHPDGAAWDLSDVVVEETDPDHYRLHWGNGCAPDLTYDLDGNPVVAYEWNQVHLTNPGVETDGRTFVVARKSNGTWSREDVLSLPYVVVDLQGGIDRGPFVAADGSGGLHLVVFVNGQLWYAAKPAGGAWTSEQIPVDAVQGTNGVGFVLEHDVPTVLFYSETQGVALASRTDTGWTTESIDPAGDVTNGALAVDPSGNLWAVYDTSSGDSWYLTLSTRAAPVPDPEVPASR